MTLTSILINWVHELQREGLKMAEMKKYDVFLSYSHKDRPWVSQFVESLREAGLTVFDNADILPGERWDVQIQEVLRESTNLIVVLSPNSVESPWTFFELGAAVADNKRIVPVLTQDMDIENIPTSLRRFQFLKEPSPLEAGERVAQVVAATRSKDAQRDDVTDKR
jgi:hypothetical protein